MPADLHIASAQDTLCSKDARLADVVDTLLAQGIVIRGEAWISVADVDLVFLGLDLILAAPDKIAAERVVQ